jgi:translation initiation factor 1
MRLFEGTAFDVPPRCERCQELEYECKCPPLPRELTAPEKQTAKLSIEKRKKGKVVTVVRGLLAQQNDLPALLTRLKNSCGAGGTVEGDELEIQGEHRERVTKILQDLGYRVR